MTSVIDGLGVLFGYYFLRRFYRVNYMTEPLMTNSEKTAQTVSEMVAQDELSLRYNAQLRLVATVILGIVLVLSSVGIMVLSVMRIEIPPALSAIGGTAIGALVASLNTNSKR